MTVWSNILQQQAEALQFKTNT